MNLLDMKTKLASLIIILFICFNAVAAQEPLNASTKKPATHNITIKIADTTAHAGKQGTLSFSITNDIPISSFQCDLSLPAGIKIAVNEDGKKLIQLNKERSIKNGHSCLHSTLSNGCTRIICFAMGGTTLIGNEGEVMTATVDIDKSVAAGKYTIELRNIEIVGPNESSHKISSAKATLTIVAGTN